MEQEKNYLERASYTWSKDSIRLMLTPGTAARHTYLYAQEAGYFKTEFPYFTEREYLESFLIVYTISGEGLLKYQGNSYRIKKGECFYINCEEHHYYETPKGMEWEFLWIHINGNGAMGYYQEFVKNGFLILQFQEGFFMESTLRRIIALYQRMDITTEIQADNLIHNLLAELLLRSCTDGAEIFYIPGYIKNAAVYIEEHFKEDVCLNDFADMYGRSKYHIAKEFKKYMGVTINERIILARISCAKELLKYSEMTIGEIAFEVGMSNVTHFINLFKDRENLTPLSYRKKWKR